MKKKLIIPISLISLIALIALLYVSYGFVSARITNNELSKKQTFMNQKLEIEYSDGTETLTSNNTSFIPGSTITKTFTIKPKATNIISIKSPAPKQIQISWAKRTTQVTGYQIRYSTNSSMSSAKTKTISSYKTTSNTIKSLKAKKKYYVQVRTYKTVNGTRYYSDWSTKKYVTTK
jgi:hypothetical protein